MYISDEEQKKHPCPCHIPTRANAPKGESMTPVGPTTPAGYYSCTYAGEGDNEMWRDENNGR